MLPISGRESPISERFFDYHAESLRVGTFERFCGGALEEIPRGLYRVEQLDGERLVNGLGLARTRDGQPDGEARRFDPAELHEHGAVLQDSAFKSGRVDLKQ